MQLASDVKDIVLKRAADRSQPGRRNDPFRVALCIEGGAMRGVVSAGMVTAIEQLGLLSAFDVIYGSSGGAMNGAYLLAGQAAFGTTIYYNENIATKSFIDVMRPTRGRPIVDLDYLIWNVMNGTKRLDVERVLASPIPLKVVATQVPLGHRVVFEQWDSREDFLKSLRAGASMPIVAGAPYEYRRNQFWDAMLTEPVPVLAAEEGGATHIVVLLTRPRGTSGPRLSMSERLLFLPRLKRYSDVIAAQYAERGRQYAELVQALWAGHTPSQRTPVLAIGPVGRAVGKLERDREQLVRGAANGFKSVLVAFGLPEPTVIDVLCGFTDQGVRLCAGA